MKTNFIDETMQKNKNQDPRKLEPKMLPARFRERTTFSQRMYLFLIVFLYAVAIGVITFVLLAGIAEKINNVFKDKTMFLVLTMSFSMISLFSGAITPIWSKNRKNLFTLFEFFNIIASPLVYIISYSYLSVSFKEADYINDPRKLLFFIGLITLLSNLIPIFLTFIKTIFNYKRYSISLYKTILISVGNIVISTANLAVWLLSDLDDSTKVIKLSELSFVLVGIIIGVGIMLTIIGLIISMKWDISGARSMWSSVRISGALPSLVIYSALIAIGLRFMSYQLTTPLIITITIDCFLLLFLSLYVWFRGRIINLIKTNPIYNNIILKVFTIFVAFTGLINVSLMEKIVFLKNYGPSSFEILAITSITIICGIFLAHIGKLVTYSKLFKMSILGSFLSLFIIIVIVLSIVSIKNSKVILGIISNEVVSLFLVTGLVIDIILLFVDISIISSNVIKGNKEKVKVEDIKKGDK